MPRAAFRPLPMEWLAVASAGIALVLRAVFSLQLYLPDTHSSAFALEHYLAGIALSAVLLFLVYWKQHRAWPVADFLSLARQLLAFSLIVYLHFNFKLWAMLINTARFDHCYAALDQTFTTAIQAFGFINLGFTPLKALLPDAYHDVFVAMFLVTFLVLAMRQQRMALEQCLLAVALVLVIGGLAYIPAPAFGPFFMLPDTGSHADRIQQDMHGFMQAFIASHGAHYAGGNFIMPLAAMPSLHIAHACVFLYYAWKHLRWLGYIYLPLFVFLSTEAVVSRWHYLIDLAAGLPLAWLCIGIAGTCLGTHSEPPKSTGKKSV